MTGDNCVVDAVGVVVVAVVVCIDCVLGDCCCIDAIGCDCGCDCVLEDPVDSDVEIDVVDLVASR